MHDLARILAELSRRIADHPPGVALAERLCLSAVDLLDADGGAITLAYTEHNRLTLTVTDPVAEAIEGLQDVVQQGPGVEAYTVSDYRSFVVDREAGPDARWPLLDLSALDDQGPVVIHAVPMHQGTATVGVLTLWQRGRTSSVDPDTALLVASVIAAALAEQLHDEAGALAESWAERSMVHQAAGFVVAELRVPTDDALALVRAQAYVRGQSMTQTARDIIERRLTFSGGPDEGNETR